MLACNPFERPNPLYVQCTSAGPGYYAPDAKLECVLRHKPLGLSDRSERDTVDKYINNRLELLQARNPFLTSSRSTTQLLQANLDLRLESMEDDMYFSRKGGETERTRANTFLKTPTKSPSRARPFSPSVSSNSLTNPFLSAKHITNSPNTPYSTMGNMMGELYDKSQTSARLNNAMGGMFDRAQTQTSLNTGMAGLFDRAQTQTGLNNMMAGLYERSQNDAALNGMMGGLYSRAQTQAELNNAMAGLYNRGQTEAGLNNAMGALFNRAQADGRLNNAMGALFDRGQADGRLNDVMGNIYNQAQSQAGLNNGMAGLFDRAQAEANMNGRMGELFNQGQVQGQLNNGMGRLFDTAERDAERQAYDGVNALISGAVDRKAAEQQYNIIKNSIARRQAEESRQAEQQYQLVRGNVQRQKAAIDGMVLSLAHLAQNESRVPLRNQVYPVDDYTGRLLVGEPNQQSQRLDQKARDVAAGLTNTQGIGIQPPPPYVNPFAALNVQQQQIVTQASRGQDVINVEGKSYYRIPMKNPRSMSAAR